MTSLSLGNSYPLLSNARIRPADGQGGLVRPVSFPKDGQVLIPML